MLTKLLAVEIDVCEVIRSAKVDEDPSVGLPLIIKRFLVPNRAFVKEQLLRLRIPVAGNPQRFGLVEVVFDQLAWTLGLFALVKLGFM